MERYVCIHGHFYQPPRDNPWLEAIEWQESAHPYHDWNERITAECYAPNTAARILDGRGRITQMVNNYARISFNFGPTLLAWIEHQAPEVYAALLAADQASQQRFSGHGSALAQAYNHLILPLANRRDKYTQILWGIEDFTSRFRRAPEGIWLPETAVDLETLDICADLGIRFTILAPSQAHRVRPLRNAAWHDVRGGRIDPRLPYMQRLPSGRQIALFFYHASVSIAVAFDGLLHNGERLAHRLCEAFIDHRPGPQLVHIATDGETYGHHHRYGEMALAYTLAYLEAHHLARLTNYGEYLARHPPTHEVNILENTAWSCSHGVERWRSDCGCQTGGHPGWHQTWRTPLRHALAWLRDTLAPAYASRAAQIFHDPWAARDAYITVLLERSPQQLARFWQAHAKPGLTDEATITALKLLELQRHAMLMYTSCGWFFADPAGLETVQVLRHAGRVVQLAHELFGGAYEARFLERLQAVKSNQPEYPDGRTIYATQVIPAMVDWQHVGAHYAACALFEPPQARTVLPGYTVVLQDFQRRESEKAKGMVGRATFTSSLTQESTEFSFSAWHFGAQRLSIGVQPYQSETHYQTLVHDVHTIPMGADASGIMPLFHQHFGHTAYTFETLRRDTQLRLATLILEAALAETEGFYRQLYASHMPLVRVLSHLHAPMPGAFQAAAEVLFHRDLSRALEAATFDLDHLQALLQQAQHDDMSLDATFLRPLFQQSLERLAQRFAHNPTTLPLLQILTGAMHLVQALPFAVDLWQTQNLYYQVGQTMYPAYHRRVAQGDAQAQMWVHDFRTLGDALSVHLSAIV